VNEEHRWWVQTLAGDESTELLEGDGTVDAGRRASEAA
jgi:hypothetical protein